MSVDYTKKNIEEAIYHFQQFWRGVDEDLPIFHQTLDNMIELKKAFTKETDI